jgi:CBS domain-containing protein
MTEIAGILRSKGTDVRTVRPDMPVSHVVARLQREGVGSLVVSRDGRHLDGLVTERDVVLGLADHGTVLLGMAVREIMTAPVRTCRPGDSVKDVMTEITRGRIRQIPVVDQGELRGIVSIGDLVKRYLEDSALEVSVCVTRTSLAADPHGQPPAVLTIAL